MYNSLNQYRSYTSGGPCPCFILSRIMLRESARATVSLPWLGTLSTSWNCTTFTLHETSWDCTTFTLHDLANFYVESVTAHRIKTNDHSCFHNRWPNSKTKLKLNHFWEQGGLLVFWGALRSLRILHIGRIGSALSTLLKPPSFSALFSLKTKLLCCCADMILLLKTLCFMLDSIYLLWVVQIVVIKYGFNDN